MSVQVVPSSSIVPRPQSAVQESNTCKKVAHVFYHATQLASVGGGIYFIASSSSSKGYDVSLIVLGTVLIVAPISLYLCFHLPKYLNNKDCLSLID
jgi:hypothetical protein